MVAKKTRRLIGNVAVWGSLGWLALTNLQTYLGSHVMLPSDAGLNIIAIGAILVGLLWGLRG